MNNATDRRIDDVHVGAVHWRSSMRVVPARMITVVVSHAAQAVAELGYWDGISWYASTGEPLDDVQWWAPLPPAPRD
jgi:hypothetical protein